ncbi:MAG: 5-formyltetrahydrofolate cyclo-ligase [Actinomycetes bacterium]
MEATTGPTKADLRARVMSARRVAGPDQRREAAARATRFLLDLPDLLAARCVAAYYSIGSEPSTAELLAELRSRDVRVLLPVLRDDLDLDWAIYDQARPLVPGGRGLWAPGGDRLGPQAIADADLVVVPALAVGRDGTRLGRGGGSYDRALARVPGARPVVTMLYDGELLPDVPAEPHDRRVDVVVLPSGVQRLRPDPG